MKNQPKKEKRPTEDEKKKIKAAIERLLDATKTCTELNVPIDMIMHLVKSAYAAQKLISILEKVENELKRK